jgi:hypothetical protein
MEAMKGNKNAEKVTLEDAIELAELAYSKISDDCFFLSDLAEQCDTYRQKFEYIIEKFNDNDTVFNTIKKIYNKCESIVMKKTAEGKIVPSLGIFVLKAYHGLMETSAQKIDHTTQGDKIQPPVITFKKVDE